MLRRWFHFISPGVVLASLALPNLCVGVDSRRSYPDWLPRTIAQSDAQIKVYFRNGSSRPETFEIIDLTSSEQMRLRLGSGEQREVDLETSDGRFAKIQYRRVGTIEWTTAYSLRKFDTVTLR